MELHESISLSGHEIHWQAFKKNIYNISLNVSMNKSQEFMILTHDVAFDHDWLYYALHILNMKIMLKMILPNMYALYLWLYSLNPFMSVKNSHS